MAYNCFMKNLIDSAKSSHNLSKSEIVAILKDHSINDYLFLAADEVRKKYIGDEVYLRAIKQSFCKAARICIFLQKNWQ